MNNTRFVVSTHIMAALAGKTFLYRHYGKTEPVRSEDLAHSVNTNPVVVRRILALLQKKGLVISKPGRNGGTSMGRPAESITLRDVYEAVEDDTLFHGHNQGPNPNCLIGSCINDVLVAPLSEAAESMKQALEKYTIQDLVKYMMKHFEIDKKMAAGYTFEQFKAEFEAQAADVAAAATRSL